MEKILQTLIHRALSMLTKTSMRIVLLMMRIQKFSPPLLFQMKKVCILIALPSLSNNCGVFFVSSLHSSLHFLLFLHLLKSSFKACCYLH